MSIRLIIYVVVAVLLIGSFVSIKVLYTKWRRAEKDRQDSNAFNLSHEQATTTWYKNRLDMEVAKVKTLTLSYKNLKDLRESERIKFVREFQGVKKNLRNVDAIIAANAQLKNSITLLISNDSLKKFRHIDKFDSISGIVYTDSITINRTVNVPIQGVLLWQRGKVLGIYRGWPAKKHWEAQLTSPNPNVKITNFEFIQIRRK